MMTKKTLFSLSIIMVLLLGTINNSHAQKIEISPFIGYETGANVHTSLGHLIIGDGMDWGGSVNVGMGGGRYIELSYSHLKSYLDFQNVTTQRLCDLSIDYYSIGALQEIRPAAKVTPYGLFTLGWVNYRPSDTYSNENKMHISLAGGVKINASEKIGIRLQARLLMPLYYAGTYFSFGTGGGGYGISGGAVAIQGDFTAALVLKIR